jgi:DNA-binding transcriptional MerR regulator
LASAGARSGSARLQQRSGGQPAWGNRSWVRALYSPLAAQSIEEMQAERERRKQKMRAATTRRGFSACLVRGYRVHNSDMHIGGLAAKAAVNIQTIRFYEREGLLPVPSRNQELGFTLGEIRQLLDLHHIVSAMPLPLRRKPSELRGIIAIGHERLDAINQKLRTLHTVRRRLVSLLQQLESATVATCPASKSLRKP